MSAGVTHSLGVGTVGAEGQGEGWRQDAQLAHHLLHAPQRPLLVRVSKLDHQAGGGTLQGQPQAGRERRGDVAGTLGSLTRGVGVWIAAAVSPTLEVPGATVRTVWRSASQVSHLTLQPPRAHKWGVRARGAASGA